MNSTEIKACPFCGGPAEVRPREDYYNFRVFCKDDKCGCSSLGRGQTFEQAVEWWNRRAGDRQPVTPEVEGVKALASATGWASLVEAAKEWRKAEKRHALMELGELGGDSNKAKSIAERKLHAVRIAADKCEAMPNVPMSEPPTKTP